MTYTIVGTGNMAYFIATRLHNAGFSCKGIWGRNQEEAEKIATTVHAPVLSSLQAVSDESDVCIIAVSDNAIQEISRQLSLDRTVVIHTAGSATLDLLQQKNKAVLWPVYSILKNDLPQERTIPVICEANNTYSEEYVLKTAKAVTDNVTVTTYPKRQWMHLIAAFVNNFTNHLIAIGESLSEEQHIYFDLFKPILQQTFDRLQTGNAIDLQTGAAKRDDEATMQKHIALLVSHPKWQEVYKILSTSIKDLYSAKDE